MERMPEILAPAGDFATLKAAVSAGADAIYLGGEQFGARAFAKNFTEEELCSAIDYAHLHGRKIYLISYMDIFSHTISRGWMQ